MERTKVKNKNASSQSIFLTTHFLTPRRKRTKIQERPSSTPCVATTPAVREGSVISRQLCQEGRGKGFPW
jgi:hypothetical protein